MGSINDFLLSTKREEQKENGVWIKIKVRTGKGGFSIRRKEGKYIIDVKSLAEKGKANAEILRELKKIFKTNVQIMYGIRSHIKIIFIEDITVKQLQDKMSHLAGEYA